MAQYPSKSPHYEENKKAKKKCVLMYSGGLDTSICVYLLQEYYGYDVITLTIDVLQNNKDAAAMAEKAKKLGAIKAIVYDAKDEYADHFASQVIKANGMYDDKYPLGTSLARPLQAKIATEVAIKEGAQAVAHGCKGRGADAFRLNMTFNYLLPDNIKLVLPINDWWPTRQEEVDFAYEKNIPVPVSQENPFSYDDNILSNAINYGSIDDIEQPLPENAFKWTNPVEKTPDTPEEIEIEFKNGLPISVNGKKMKLSDMLFDLNILAGKHGIGRMDMIENGLYGNKFRWVYEAPAAEVLIMAHTEIEKLVLPQQSLYFKHYIIDKKWTEIAYKAFFFNPLCKSLMAFIEHTQQYVNGSITLKLFKGKVWIVKRKCDASLIKLDPKDIVAKEVMDTVPYGFEEYSFASKHPEVVQNHFNK